MRGIFFTILNKKFGGQARHQKLNKIKDNKNDPKKPRQMKDLA